MTDAHGAASGDDYKYKAFLSYSHDDDKTGERLFKALEGYRIPKRVIGTVGRYGPRPEKLRPIFRDREELNAAHDLNEKIKDALAQSACLIVMCSPNAARSRWVNEEILEFKRLGREDRIFAFTIEGHPTGEDEPSLEELASRTGAAAKNAPPPSASFPRALKYKLGKDGKLSTERTHPLAADARARGDGWENAKLKLIAGLLDLDFDVLKQREVEAQRARLRLQAAGVAMVVAVILGLIVFFLNDRANRAHEALLDASAQQFVAAGNGELFQRDYARAEIDFAQSLTFRDLPATRKLLLAARLGGVSSVSRSALGSHSELNIISGDGSLVAVAEKGVAGAPAAVSIQATGSRQELWRLVLPATAGIPDSIAFSAHSGNTRQIAAGWPEHEATTFHVGVWTLEDGRPAANFRELSTGTSAGGHTKRIPSIAFNPMHPWLATGGEDGKLTMWDLSPAKPDLLWERCGTHAPDVHGIAFSADGAWLASGGGDYLVKVWKADDTKDASCDDNPPATARKVQPVYTLAGHVDSVFVVAFSPDGKRIASGGYDRTIRIWDLTLKGEKGAPQPQTIATLSGHDGTIFALSFSGDGKLLASGASDGTVDLWDTNADRLLDKFKPGDGIVRSVVTPSFDNGVHIGSEHGWSVWSVAGSSLVRRLWTGGSTVGIIAFDPTGEYVAVSGGGDDGRIRVWDRSYRLVHLLDPKSPTDYTDGIAFSPDGHWIVSGGTNSVIHVWDRHSRDWAKFPTDDKVLAHGGAIWGLCFDPKGRWLASSNQSPAVQIKRWNPANWSLIDHTPELADSVYALVCDPSGNRLVAGDSKARVTVLDTKDLATTESVVNVHQGEVNVWSLALMDSPHAILSGNSDGYVRRWVPKDAGWSGTGKGKILPTSADDAKVNPTINSVAYNAKYGWVAAGGVGPSVEIYDKDLHHLRSLSGHDGTIWWVTFDPQGSRLAYGGLDGIVRVVDIAVMRHLDDGVPADLFHASQLETGLSVQYNSIVRLR